MRVIKLESVDSTMLEARRLLAAGETGPFAVVAKTQSGGVGRLGRPWASPEGGLWLTVAVPQRPCATLHPLTSVRVATLVWAECSHSLHSDWTGRHPTELFDTPLHIKWPNDLMDGSGISAKKVAGVLIERIAEPAFVLCGVGVNVNNDARSLPGEVSGRATSLSAVRGSVYRERESTALGERLIAELARELNESGVQDGFVLATFSEFMWRPEQEVPITLPHGDRVLGRIIDITGEGGLRVIIDGKERELRSVDQIG